MFIWAEMGDARRFSTSDDAVRYAGLDITAYASDDHRAAGHLARQGPEALRWALYEAAKNASRAASPDHPYYAQARASLGESPWDPWRLHTLEGAERPNATALPS